MTPTPPPEPAPQILPPSTHPAAPQPRRAGHREAWWLGTAAALLMALTGCETKAEEPAKSPHELAKEQVEAFAKAFGEAYQAKTVGCSELPMWPDRFKSCSKGCPPETWQGAWPGLDWKPEGKSFAHFLISSTDELADQAESVCAFTADAAMDLNDNKSFIIARVSAGAIRGRAEPVMIYNTELVGRD